MLSEIGAQIAVHICLVFESCGMTNADADSVAQQSRNNKQLWRIIKFSALVSDRRFTNPVVSNLSGDKKNVSKPNSTLTTDVVFESCPKQDQTMY